MKKIIKEVDDKKGIVQVTIADERWYLRPSKDAAGMPIVQSVPSVTWIASKYPKGIEFYKWLADKGWDEAEAIKQAAGDKGTKVHKAIESIFEGKEVRIDSKYVNPSKGGEEELTLEECDAIVSFVKWRTDTEKDHNIETILWEKVVFSQKYDYAGTVDYIVKLTHRETGEVTYWIIDFKTSQYIWKSHELQVSSYKQTIENGENEVLHHGKQIDVTNIKMAILQLGYRRNKNGYKFTQIDDRFDLFLIARKIWQEEHGDEKPTKKDYPIVLSPAITVADMPAAPVPKTEEVVAVHEMVEAEPKVDKKTEKINKK